LLPARGAGRIKATDAPVNVKKHSSTQVQASFGSYPEPRARPTAPVPITKAPPSTVFCSSQLCLEIKYNIAYYLRKCDLMRYLREQHDFWWANYTGLYERDAYTYPTSRNAQGWDYTNAAKEMLSRCKLYDSLFTQVLKLDLAQVSDFGTYCKLVFLEINKLKPAFPDSPCSQLVFEHSVRDAMRCVLRQAPAGFPQDPADLGLAISPDDTSPAELDDL
jgi:hypothetical protein